jgi:hypothetical protein
MVQKSVEIAEHETELANCARTVGETAPHGTATATASALPSHLR